MRNFVQYLIAFCSRPEATSDVITGRFVESIVPENHVKFGDDSRLNLSQEFLPEAVGGKTPHSGVVPRTVRDRPNVSMRS